jgi:hypothetical protein
MDLDSDVARPAGPLRHLIERITGMPTIVGSEIYEDNLQSAITKKICDAFVVLADITDDNLNTCIEAGIGLAAGTNVELLSRGKSRRPPFMLRLCKCLHTRTTSNGSRSCTDSCTPIGAESSMRNCRDGWIRLRQTIEQIDRIHSHST